MNPPLGLDAQAAYEASLRLALGRRDREHRPEHLAVALVALDPGVAWMVRDAGLDAGPLVADLIHAFFGPGRSRPSRLPRHRARRRADAIARRYGRTCGRTPAPTAALATILSA